MATPPIATIMATKAMGTEGESTGAAFGAAPESVNADTRGRVGCGELHVLGFTMILYPTSVLFRVARTIEHALNDLLAGVPMSKRDGCSMEEFEDIVDMKRWRGIEARFPME